MISACYLGGFRQGCIFRFSLKLPIVADKQVLVSKNGLNMGCPTTQILMFFGKSLKGL